MIPQVGEVGELSEIFQWKGEVPKGLPDWKEEEKVHLGEELSDVLLYLVRLSDMCGVDLGKAALRKVELNAIKYPKKLSEEAPSITTKEDADLEGVWWNCCIIMILQLVFWEEQCESGFGICSSIKGGWRLLLLDWFGTTSLFSYLSHIEYWTVFFLFNMFQEFSFFDFSLLEITLE